jgi:hypothetical protein
MANIFSMPGANSKYKLQGARPAGFLGGLWHGLTAVIAFMLSVSTAKVSVWETNNNGRWYEFGFLIGIGAFASQPYVRIHETSIGR